MIDLHSVIRWSGHVSFVGGKNEPGETDEDTVKREVFEEIGIDLNDGYIKVGRLDEREITSIKDNKLLMILSPFGNLNICFFVIIDGVLTIRKKKKVYLQIVPNSPPFQLQTTEVAAVECLYTLNFNQIYSVTIFFMTNIYTIIGVPLSFFTSNQPYVNHSITEYLTLVQFKNRFFNRLIRFLMGSVTFPAIHLPTSTQTTFKLWGLTLGMTNDIIEFTRKNNLAFLKLTKSKPIYSRKDIALLANLITQLRYLFQYGKIELNPNSCSLRYENSK